MSEELTHAERVRELVDRPDKYPSLVADYNSDKEFYNKARNKAPMVLETFEEYIDFFRIFVEYGPTEFVYYDLKVNTERSLKNMILRDSKAGQAYPLHTLKDVQARIEIYNDLGFDAPSLRDVVETTVEHIYTEDRFASLSYEIASSLLSSIPAGYRDAVELLARVQLVDGALEASNPERYLSQGLDRYLQTVGLVASKDQRTIEDLRREVEACAPHDPQKIELVEELLHQVGSDSVLLQLLYYSARDVIERYRHQSRRQPSHTELIIAHRQLQLLQKVSLEDWETSEKAYAKMYFHLADALRESGGQWETSRDYRRQVDANFAAAAQSYLRAAHSIRTVNDNRYIKCVSKAFKHASNASESWISRRDLHDNAIVVLYILRQKEDWEPEVLDTLTGSVTYHTFWQHVAQGYCDLWSGRFSKCLEEIEEAQDTRKDAPQNTLGESAISRLEVLVEARMLEVEMRDFEYAARNYESVQKGFEGLENRMHLSRIKQQLNDGVPKRALEIAANVFEDNSLLVQIVTILAGEEIRSVRNFGDLPSDLPGTSRSDREELAQLLQLCVVKGDFQDAMCKVLRESLYEL